MVNKFLFPKGGSETYVLKLGSYLKSQGHEVQYFGMEHEERCVGNNIDQYTTNMDFHEGSKLSKIIYPLKTIYSFEARKKIRLVLEDFCPNIIHLNNFNYQLTPSIILEIQKWRKEGNKCRIIFTAHDYQLICPNHMCNNPNTKQNCEKCLSGNFSNCVKGRCIHGSFSKSVVGALEATYWSIRHTYQYIDKIICCSEFLKTKMDKSDILKNKTIVLHNFVDKIEKRYVKKKNYVLYFGRFSAEKGIDTLVRACSELPDVQFVFAGTGPLMETINKEKNIKNVGFKKGEELKKLIREAKFSIYPSEWYENCPFSVMESQMLGTPVLGADIGGIPELIKDGKTGELFKSGDVKELKRKIKKIWENSEVLKAYSDNCYDVQFDTVESYTKKMMKIYKGEV